MLITFGSANSRLVPPTTPLEDIETLDPSRPSEPGEFNPSRKIPSYLDAALKSLTTHRGLYLFHRVRVYFCLQFAL